MFYRRRFILKSAAQNERNGERLLNAALKDPTATKSLYRIK
jgi:hypothetical protein